MPKKQQSKQNSNEAPRIEPISIGFVALGCPKNLVDLQVMGAELHQAGFNIGVDTDEADVVLVNTCAFIEDAREEAISSILSACELKKNGKCKAVVVSGCLPQRYRDKILKACPDVDAVIGVDDLEHIPEIVRQAYNASSGDEKIIAVSTKTPSHLYTSKIPSLVLTGGPFAYLKIAEGCQHACAFCAIPGIRGKLRSKNIDEIVTEAKAILQEGIREINIIAQDVTSYGIDLKDGTSLAALLRKLDALEGDFWIRLLYGYPGMVTDELLDVMASSRHICHYLDIPIQHSHPDILRAMLRADTVERVPEMTEHLRSRIPDIVVRTTCLVGFPGETEAQFNHLLDFVNQVKFDHLGAFAFSPEEGTPAFDMDDDSDDIVAESRRRKIMKHQAKIAKKRLAGMVGTLTRILLEVPPEDDDGLWEGRNYGQAPDDIDGVSYIRDVPAEAKSGDFINVKIIDSDDYDLVCEYQAP